MTDNRILRLSDGQTVSITDGRSNSWNPTWSADGSALYFVSNRAGTMDLWRQPVTRDGEPGGQAQPVSTGLGIPRSGTFSPDGARFAYSRGRKVRNVGKAALLEDRRATWADVQELTFDQALIEFLDLSPQGEKLLVSSDHSGNQDLWMLPAGGGAMTQLNTDRPLIGDRAGLRMGRRSRSTRTGREIVRSG